MCIRDSWYHVVLAVDTTQATSSNRVKIYVNGTQQSFDIANYPSQNYDCTVNTQVAHLIGGYAAGNSHFDGYLAEYNFIDGTALDPTSFGELKNSVWIPKSLSSLTYGTNGFRLTFADSSSLGDDTSGNGNDFTSSGLASTDVSNDSPTNNFCTLNPLYKQSSSALSEGNLKAVLTGGGNSARTPSTFAVSSGKWYWEVRQSSSNRFAMGVFDTDNYVMANEDGGTDAYEWVYVTDDNSGAGARKNNGNMTTGYGLSLIHI